MPTMEPFFSDFEREELSKANQQTTNGFLLLYDIKDSTARKREYKNRWIDHTKALYQAFRRLCLSMRDDLEIKGTPIIKFKGDGLMAFFPTSAASNSSSDDRAPTEASMTLLRQAYLFRETVHVEMAELLGDMRLKAVVCYLTGISRVGKGSGKDVLGRGVDFAHRLETYADASHIVVNDMLYRVLPQHDDEGHRGILMNGADDLQSRLYGVECSKVVKGWEGEQKLWLLTNQELIETTMENMSPSPHDSNALAELFCYYVKSKREETSGQLSEAQNYRKRAKRESE